MTHEELKEIALSRPSVKKLYDALCVEIDKPLTTFERKMKNPKFNNEFEKLYKNHLKRVEENYGVD